MRTFGKIIAVCFALTACLTILPTGGEVQAQADSGEIAVYFDGKRVENASAFVERGVMWVPFRPLMASLGAKVSFDPKKDGEIRAVIGQDTMSLWAGDSLVAYRDREYSLSQEIRTIRGQVYFPARGLGELLHLEVVYDSKARRANLAHWGLGQEDAVKAVVSSFLDPKMNGQRASLLTSDNPALKYYEYEPAIMEKTYREFETWVGDIDYTSATTATVNAGTRSESQVMKRVSETEFKLRREGATWRIAKHDGVHLNMDLPSDADETEAELKRNHPDEVAAVLRDVQAFHDAYNAEDVNGTTRLLSSNFKTSWKKITGEDYDGLMEAFFAGDIHERKEILTARVLYIEGDQAVVHLKMRYSEQEGDGTILEDDPYELIVGLDLENGHWAYNFDEEWDITQDY